MNSAKYAEYTNDVIFSGIFEMCCDYLKKGNVILKSHACFFFFFLLFSLLLFFYFFIMNILYNIILYIYFISSDISLFR